MRPFLPHLPCILGLLASTVGLAEDPPVPTAGFEAASPGAFAQLDTPVGRWSPETGRTVVDHRHAKSGSQCLQLTGGPETTVVLHLAEGVDTSGTLSFWAERWTRHTPFSFRIEKEVDGTWTEIYNGDGEVRVGRAFLSHVKVPLRDPEIRQLRFTVTSPPGTGILIDDLRIAPVRPQRIISVASVPFTLPALVGAEASALCKLRIETTGELAPISVVGIRGRLETTDGVGHIQALRVERTATDAFTPSRPLARAATPGPDGGSLTVPTGTCELAEGTNTLWLTAELAGRADLDSLVGASVDELALSNGETHSLDAPPVTQRLGIALRQHGDDGVHTYRIPGLATTTEGTLIAVYDVRHRNGGDLPGDIDVGMSRSTDGGRTWEPMRTIMDMGNDPKWRYDGSGDPSVLVDQTTGTIWVAATWSHGDRSWHGSGPGLTPEETGQFMLVRSDDDGLTWSAPINITTQVKLPDWCFVLQGPGKGIAMRDGTLVFPAQYQAPPDQRRLPHSTIIASRDHGATWAVGTGAFGDTTEAQVVEIEPGVLMLNCRCNRASTRVVMTTGDMGETWHRHPTSERALIEPRACMASLIDVDRETGTDAGGWLLFSNPDSTGGRKRITIKASPDRGLTWPEEHRLLLDEGSGRGYSCMSMIDADTVGILYECSQADLAFQRIPLTAVTRGLRAADRK